MTERRALHYETMAVVAAALALRSAEDFVQAWGDLDRAVEAYLATEALLKAEAT